MATRSIEEIIEHSRTYSDWSSTKGLRTDTLPWRLWENAKKLMWDPADIDFSQDAEDFKKLNEEQQIVVSGLARGFMVGEEGVTLDILPLILAIADEGRAEETMFLTTFAFEEAKHVDFFRRWFDAIGADPLELEKKGRERMRERGVEPPDYERRKGLFEYGLPRIMRRLLTDRSPQAFLDAGVTYNQFVEGCLAIAGYRMWSGMFEEFGVLPGMQEGLKFVQRDERRHIAYGTYLCRRIIAQNPELGDWAQQRMYELRDYYFEQFQGAGAARAAQGNGQQDPSESPGAGDAYRPFVEMATRQVDRRCEILERAKTLNLEEAESGLGAEEEEEGAEEAYEMA